MLKIISAQLEEQRNENLPIITPETVNQYIEPEEDEEEIQTTPPAGLQQTNMPGQEEIITEAPEVVEDAQGLIEEAIKDQQCIAFEYTSINSNNYLGWRLIEPVGQWQTKNTMHFLVVGFDRMRQGIRAFSIDNMHPGTLKILPGQFYSFEPKFIFNPQY